MLQPVEPLPVKVVAGVLYRDPAAWDRAVPLLEAAWGRADVLAEPVPFDETDYYEDEMGTGLLRRFAGFAKLVPPDALPELKLAANRIEEALLEDGRRTVNVDVGYLDYHKLVLASTKEGARKIYTGRGIWADMTLIYVKGAFVRLPWTFPDLCDATRYEAFLLEARHLYKAAVRDR